MSLILYQSSALSCVRCKGIPVNPCSSSTRRPLHIAARNGLATVVQVLLSRGAAVMAVDEEGKQQVERILSLCNTTITLNSVFHLLTPHRPYASFGLCTKQERSGVSRSHPLHHEAFSSQRGQYGHHIPF